MPNERQTDLIISKLLDDAEINHSPNGSDILEIKNALATASKRGTNRQGFPEYTAVVNDFVIVVEDKAESKFQANYLDQEKKNLLMDAKSIILPIFQRMPFNVTILKRFWRKSRLNRLSWKISLNAQKHSMNI